MEPLIGKQIQGNSKTCSKRHTYRIEAYAAYPLLIPRFPFRILSLSPLLLPLCPSIFSPPHLSSVCPAFLCFTPFPFSLYGESSGGRGGGGGRGVLTWCTIMLKAGHHETLTGCGAALRLSWRSWTSVGLATASRIRQASCCVFRYQQESLAQRPREGREASSVTEQQCGQTRVFCQGANQPRPSCPSSRSRCSSRSR